METYYILRLAKELRRNLTCLRKDLYAKEGHHSLLALEPCIILGSTQTTDKAPFVSCPPLPMLTENHTVFSQGHLYLPLSGSPLQQLREELKTSFGYDGIFLGEQALEVEIPHILIKDVSLAILTIKREGELIAWNVSSEKHLYSGKEMQAGKRHN